MLNVEGSTVRSARGLVDDRRGAPPGRRRRHHLRRPWCQTLNPIFNLSSVPFVLASGLILAR